jgi:hypothetical protein
VSTGQYIDVPGLARAVLEGVTAHFADSPVSLPDRRVIAPGETRQIAWDCPAVVVACGGILWGQGPGSSGVGRRTGNPVSVGARYTIITVQIIRCGPEHDGTEPPTADELTTAGVAALTDAGLLSQALVEVCGKGGVLHRAGVAVAGAVEILGPAGGFTAVEGNVTVTASTLV